jgi:hypothetical protein
MDTACLHDLLDVESSVWSRPIVLDERTSPVHAYAVVPAGNVVPMPLPFNANKQPPAIQASEQSARARLRAQSLPAAYREAYERRCADIENELQRPNTRYSMELLEERFKKWLHTNKHDVHLQRFADLASSAK